MTCCSSGRTWQRCVWAAVLAVLDPGVPALKVPEALVDLAAVALVSADPVEADLAVVVWVGVVAALEAVPGGAASAVVILDRKATRVINAIESAIRMHPEDQAHSSAIAPIVDVREFTAWR